MNYFVSAIGTDSGKTLFSAILTEFLQADYWKPIQSGTPRDTETVRELVSNEASNFYQESYLLNTPASPHASALIDKVQIKLDKIIPPVSNRDLVIEGAGGLLVPLNDDDYVVDIAANIPCEMILVSNLYLGSINHTLLSVDYLKKRGLMVKGLVFNGPANHESQRIILQKSGWPLLLHIDQEPEITPEVVRKYVIKLGENWI